MRKWEYLQKNLVSYKENNELRDIWKINNGSTVNEIMKYCKN